MIRLCLTFLTCLLLTAAQEEFRVANMFSSGMVFQVRNYQIDCKC